MSEPTNDGATWVPITPGGTFVFDLEADTEERAWELLLEDTRQHGMPYKTIEDLRLRGIL